MVTLLGSGSYGNVTKLEVPHLARTWALKKVDPTEVFEACIREAYVLQFRHPNIVRCDWIELKRTCFKACLELGVPLTEKIQYNTRNDPLAVAVARDMLSALHFLHRHDIIHRDLKTANIICVGNVYKLIDFNLAAIHNPTSPMASNVVSKCFRSPELLTAEYDFSYDGRIDIWSLGLVIYECQNGRLLFLGEVNEMLEQIAQYVPIGIYQDMLVPYPDRLTADQICTKYKVIHTSDMQLVEVPNTVVGTIITSIMKDEDDRAEELMEKAQKQGITMRDFEKAFKYTR